MKTLSCEKCFPTRTLYDGVQRLAAVNNFRLVCCLFQIVYYVHSQPEFRRNLARRDVTGDVWEQKGIPLSLPATRARWILKPLKSSTKLLPPLFLFFPPLLLKSN